MFQKLFIAFAFAILVALPNTSVQAQSPDVSTMVARMQAIIVQMEELQKEFKQLASSLGSSAPAGAVLGVQTSTGPAVFTMSLANGETNDDIKRIQTLLATDPAIYPYGVASGFFGPKTEEAIKNLQTRFGLSPVGVIGPATTALLEGYMRAYPNGNYPDGVLATKPKVLGVSTSAPGTSADKLSTLQSQLGALTGGGSNPAKSIDVEFDFGEASIKIKYNDGTRKNLIAEADEEDEVIDYIVSKTKLTQAQVKSVIDFTNESDDRRSSSSGDYDESDADDALDDADNAIDDAQDEIDEADDKGDDVDWAEDTLDEAKDLYDEAEEAYEDEDWDEAVELAKEAEDMADLAIDRIDEERSSAKGDSDEIESIEVEVDEGESEVFVEYENGDKYEFTVGSDKEDNIIEEIADELDIDEDEVEDLIEFDFGDVDWIDVRVNENDSRATVYYESGVKRSIKVSSTKESKIITAIAKAIDEDEEDVEDWTEFD